MKIPNRNDPCPCGSGKKYKHCCGSLSAAGGKPAQTAAPTARGSPADAAAALDSLLARAIASHRGGRLDEAIAAYRAVLAGRPQAAEIYNNLGLALQAQGKLDAAAASYRQALSLKPDSAEAYGNLGNLLQGQGRMDEAVACYRSAISLKPDIADLHYNLGLAFMAQDQPDAAIDSYRQTLQLQPENVAACINLGNALQRRGWLDEAAAAYQQALRLKPDFIEAQVNLGKVLQELGRTDEAIACFRTALSLKPDHAEAHAGLASTHIDLGQFDLAQATLSRLLAVRPEQPAAWAMLTRLRRMTPQDENWLQVALRLASARSVSGDDAVGLWFAIGKYYDDTGQYDSAFAAYRRANELQRRRNGGLDRAALSHLYDSMMAAYDVQFLRRQRQAASQSQLPVVIIGMPRSGTSLLEQIIASHPDAAGAGELIFWEEQAYTHREKILAGNLDEPRIGELANAYERYLRRHSADAARIVDKMPANFVWAGLIHTVFPQARIIHALRNPVDTCLSIYFQNFDRLLLYATDIDDLAFYYREYARLMQHWRSVIPADRLLEVPYEALVDDQAGWSRRMIEFIGLEWDERCLNFHKTERRVRTTSNWQVRQKIYRSSTERWRHYEKHLGPLLELL